MNNSVFIFSLDLELIWGAINPPDYNLLVLLKKAGSTKLRSCIHFLLKLFERYDIPVTWATVGHIFLEHSLNWEENFNILLDDFSSNKYLFTNLLKEDPLLFYGRDIIEEIISTRTNHEIGYHSFSHPIFTKINRETAEMEIKKGVELAKKLGINLHSFVFPRNEVAYVDLLKKYGFKIYRGKSIKRYKLKKSFLRQKVNSIIDKIVASPVLPIRQNGIWCIPSSICFYDPKVPISLLFRSKIGLKWSIKSKKVFHIFMHPWNLLCYKSLQRDLTIFLNWLSKEKDKRKIKVMTMSNFAEYLNKLKKCKELKNYVKMENFQE